MMSKLARVVLLPALGVCTHVIAHAGAPPVLNCDLEQDPVRSGWRVGGDSNDRNPRGEWVDTTAPSGRHALVAYVGWWATPRFEVKSFQYYRLRFKSMVEGKGYWVTQFFDADGKPLQSDHYSGVYPSENWRSHTFCFRGRVNAVRAEVRFRAIKAPLYFDDVVIEHVSREEAARWCDEVYAGMPAVDTSSVGVPGAPLARSLKKLRSGERLRIVLLGDSIMNDTGNSAFDVLLERAYPGADVELIHSVRSGTGCTYYRHENRVKRYVLDLRPDLLIIGGISNGHDPDAIRSVIKQVRAQQDPDILVLSDAVYGLEHWRRSLYRIPKPRRDAAFRRMKAYRPALRKLATEEKVAYLDMRAHWDAYVKQARKHPMWLHRDVVHANARGQQALGRILLAYLTPISKPKPVKATAEAE